MSRHLLHEQIGTINDLIAQPVIPVTPVTNDKLRYRESFKDISSLQTILKCIMWHSMHDKDSMHDVAFDYLNVETHACMCNAAKATTVLNLLKVPQWTNISSCSTPMFSEVPY